MNDTQTTKDEIVIPFSIEGTDIRGQIVRLGDVVDDILTRHNYAEAVSRLLGEALVLTSMMGASLKFEGRLILQMQGSGPVEMLVVDYVSPETIRGYAKVDETKLVTLPPEQRTFNALMGEGHLAITIDQALDKERYQGIVALDRESLTECALAYFGKSEQILTAMKLSVGQLTDSDGTTKWRAGGLMAQSLPPQTPTGDTGATEKSLDDWERINILLNTTEDHELTDPILAPETLLYRLFHEDGVRIYDAKSVKFGCSCSAEKIHSTLVNFSKDDIREMTEDGAISARCEFCNTDYRFDPETLERL